MIKRLSFIVPFLIFCILVIYFGINLIKGPSKLPNMLEGKAIPEFSLPPIEGRDKYGLRSADLSGEISLVNIFGSWCVACLIEHSFLMKIKKLELIKIHGIDWQEKDRESGPNWLRKYGDPYTLIGDDPNSDAAIGFGVTGAPETFLVDKNGIIRHKIVGPLDQNIWETILAPMIDELKKRD